MPARLFTDEQEQEIAKLYLTPLPDGTWLGANGLGRMFNTNPHTIYNVLKRCNVPTRDHREANANGKACKPVVNTPKTPPPLCACGCEQLTAWNQRKNRWNKFVIGHYRQDKPYKHQEWLRTQYITLQRTIKEIATECGVEETAVSNYMKRFAIPKRDVVSAHIGRQSGASNPAWKGGVTPERQRLYKTQTWKQTVKAIFARDNYTCARCGRMRGDFKLHAHHIRAWADHPELRFEPSNLITLCDACHLWVHSKANTEKAFLG